MNLIYDAPRPPKVFIDTTILCGALRVDGVNRKILKAARFPHLFQPIVSRVCLFEFIRNASQGLGKGDKRVVYNQQEIEAFLNEFLDPIFQYYTNLPVNSLVGRYSVETVIRENRPIGEVLVELSGCDHETAKQIVSSQEMSEPLYRFDQEDFHVWITAIQEECNYILTTNHRRFPAQIGPIKRIHPSDFYNHLSNP
ncbi:PIN domain-containing protein [Geobacillus sp. NFOSA3]|uniref:PIN domain-containing protein n=2 Tax=Anoxybacillaceae TaxID=3120669 RepID=A0A226QMZ0_9BACL|nr:MULTISPECIES: PIN domain-containing protein [Bacillaceae]NNU92497.1 PIN domain-containing protein [Geobacillus sp. NFOSA3]PDM39301.1 PIN domain-containing protein [Parageobacillus yumthangensis]RDV21089.1 PIN domain-containing protein [Parageobacillus toebii]OXB93077.1 PIN domain-containing protein [Parageobacillus galactosidasius]PUF87898.1 PIN domain-containing protein [Geobacillus sp. LYN3]